MKTERLFAIVNDSNSVRRCPWADDTRAPSNANTVPREWMPPRLFTLA